MKFKRKEEEKNSTIMFLFGAIVQCIYYPYRYIYGCLFVYYTVLPYIILHAYVHSTEYTVHTPIRNRMKNKKKIVSKCCVSVPNKCGFYSFDLQQETMDSSLLFPLFDFVPFVCVVCFYSIASFAFIAVPYFNWNTLHS